MDNPHFWLGILALCVFFVVAFGYLAKTQPRLRFWRRCSECRRWVCLDTGEFGEPENGDCVSHHLCWCPECQAKAAQALRENQ